MEHDPAVIAGVSLAIETVIAKAVELSPGTQSRLKQLHPLTIEIHCTQPALEMFVSVEEDGGIQIASYRETKATVSIEGTCGIFPALQQHQTPRRRSSMAT